MDQIAQGAHIAQPSDILKSVEDPALVFPPIPPVPPRATKTFGRALRNKIERILFRYFKVNFEYDYPCHTQSSILEGDVYKLLAHEALTHETLDSMSQDTFGMRVLLFPRLHHLNLHYFEVELAAEVTNLKKGACDREQILRVRALLKENVNAIRDYEYLCQRLWSPKNGDLTPFHASLLPELRKIVRNKGDGSDNLYRGIGTQWRLWYEGFYGRIGGAVFGGMAFMVPVLIMAINPSTIKSLVTTSISIFFVSIAIAAVSTGSWRDVLGITAAYAAVLIVFIGNTTPVK